MSHTSIPFPLRFDPWCQMYQVRDENGLVVAHREHEIVAIAEEFLIQEAALVAALNKAVEEEFEPVYIAGVARERCEERETVRREIEELWA